MKNVLALAAVAEAATGLIVVAFPSMVVRLLFGAEISGAGILMSRVAGTALIGLGIACWPGASARQAQYGMIAYGALVMLYLVFLALAGESSGVLLWPAVVVHAIIVVVLAVSPSGAAAKRAGRPDG